MTRNVQKPFVFVVCLISLSLVALGQDTSYSTDSLMAAFSKGSQVSLKGAEITVTGVVAEIKKSKVVFKSLGNDKVICELVSSIAIEGHAVGSSLTVVGKVRGRGVLGNVTLDQCNLASSNIAPTEPATIGPSVEPSEQPIAEAEETTPPVIADEVPAKSILPAGPAQPPKTVPVAAPNAAVSSEEHVSSNPSITTFDHSHELVQENSHPPKTVSRGLFRATVAVLLGIGAVLAFVKLRPAIVAGLRPPTFPTTDAMRRAALETLLLKEKKQKAKGKARS